MLQLSVCHELTRHSSDSRTTIAEIRKIEHKSIHILFSLCKISHLDSAYDVIVWQIWLFWLISLCGDLSILKLWVLFRGDYDKSRWTHIGWKNQGKNTRNRWVSNVLIFFYSFITSSYWYVVYSNPFHIYITQYKILFWILLWNVLDSIMINLKEISYLILFHDGSLFKQHLPPWNTSLSSRPCLLKVDYSLVAICDPHPAVSVLYLSQ